MVKHNEDFKVDLYFREGEKLERVVLSLLSLSSSKFPDCIHVQDINVNKFITGSYFILWK